MKPNNISNKKVLISPLNWGMGHVARCIPLIDKLLKQENEVFIACNQIQKNIFHFYFHNQNILYIEHAGYPFEFKGKGRFMLDILFSYNRLRIRRSKELEEVDNMVDLHKIDLIISDHRYGFFSNKCTTIFMTHQLNLPVKPLFQFVQRIHERELRKFDLIWVLDNEKSTFAGNLSLNLGQFNVHYIGLLSRFSMYSSIGKTYPIVVVVSGPEPYAKQFFLEQLQKAKERSVETIIIAPKMYVSVNLQPKIKILLMENWIEKDEVIRRAKKIISRSGYSTIMDVMELNAEFEFVPTVGQSEQIYLSKLYQS